MIETIFLNGRTTIWAILTFVALFLTLLAVVYYALETRGLRKETVKQTELSLRPFVILTFDERTNRYNLNNLGNGVALKVEIEDIFIAEEESGRVRKHSFQEFDVIPAKEERDFEIRVEGKNGSFELGAILPSLAIKSYNFLIKYTDINKTQYETTGKLEKGEVVIEGTEKTS